MAFHASSMHITLNSVEEVALPCGQVFYKFQHRTPGRFTQALGPLSVFGNPALADEHVTGMKNGILILFHEIRILRLLDGCNLHLVHHFTG